MTKTRIDLVVVEAMAAAAVCVVAPAHGTFVQLEHDKVTGLLSRSGGAGRLAECLRLVLGNGGNRRLSAASRWCYEAQFTPKTGLANLVAGYEAAIARRPCEPR